MKVEVFAGVITPYKEAYRYGTVKSRSYLRINLIGSTGIDNSILDKVMKL